MNNLNYSEGYSGLCLDSFLDCWVIFMGLFFYGYSGWCMIMIVSLAVENSLVYLRVIIVDR